MKLMDILDDWVELSDTSIHSIHRFLMADMSGEDMVRTFSATMLAEGQRIFW